MLENEVVQTVINLLREPLFNLAGTEISGVTALVFFLIIFVTFVASRLLQRALRGSLQRRDMESGTIDVTNRLTHYVVMAVGIAIAINMVGINLTALFAAGAVFAVAIGFGMQNISENFIAGVILLAERTIKPGDVLEVNGERVRIVHLGIRSTVARTRDEENVIIPNSILVSSVVTNYTLHDPQIRLRISVGVAYESDLGLVRETLEEAAKALEWRDKSMDPVVFLKDFGSSSVDYEISVWVHDPWTMPEKGKSMLNEAVWCALKSNSITIAFPQVDVHFDEPVERSLRSLRAAG